MSLSRRRNFDTGDQPALPLDVEAETPGPARRGRSRSRSREPAPVQLALDGFHEEEPEPAPSIDRVGPPSSLSSDESPAAGPPEPEPEHGLAGLPVPEPEPPDFDSDPFAEIPGFTPMSAMAGEFVLLPASLRGRLDLREFTRFLAALPTVVKDWEGAPEVDDGGVRLRGAEGGAWVYPEAKRVRVVLDGTIRGAVGEDLVALCRWLETRAGMLLYPEGGSMAAGVDRSLDPWETFLGR